MCLCKHPLNINLKFYKLVTQCGTFLYKPNKTVISRFTSSLNRNEKVNKTEMKKVNIFMTHSSYDILFCMTCSNNIFQTVICAQIFDVIVLSP